MGIAAEVRRPLTRTAATAIPDVSVTALAGTANDTLQAIPDLADAPATADALRDDLVANVLPALRNNTADLAAKVDAILAHLRSRGGLAP